jgi:hypothetical protein
MSTEMPKNRRGNATNVYELCRTGRYYARQRTGDIHATVWRCMTDVGTSDRLVGVASNATGARRVVADMAAQQ